MFADLLRHLTAASDTHDLAPDKSRLALAALMVRLARSDGNYSAGEQRRIDRVLAAQLPARPGRGAARSGPRPRSPRRARRTPCSSPG